MATPIPLYYPNLIGYGRIVLMLAAMLVFKCHPLSATIFYSVSQLLDAVDGTVARKYNQSSLYGAVLDQLTDRMSTLGIFMLLASVYPSWVFMLFIICLLDMAGHWCYTHAQALGGSASHKTVPVNSWTLLKAYYENRIVMFACHACYETMLCGLLIASIMKSHGILYFGSECLGEYILCAVQILILIATPLAVVKMVGDPVVESYPCLDHQWGSDSYGRLTFDRKREKMIDDFSADEFLSPRTEQSSTSSGNVRHPAWRLSHIKRPNGTPGPPVVKQDELFLSRKPISRTAPPPNLPKRTVQCGIDLKTTCRLVGLHSRPRIDKSIKFNIGRFTDTFSIITVLDIGNNLKCIIAKEPMSQYCRRKLEDINLGYVPDILSPDQTNEMKKNLCEVRDSSHLYFIFNWFSPQKIWDFCSLGLQLLMKSSDLDGLLGKIYVQKADEFLCQLSPNVIDHRTELITTTGFSLGGSIAHAFAYRLSFESLPVRVVGMGCPRPGGREFGEWFSQELTTDSLNIVIYDEIPDPLTGLVRYEYDPVALSTRKGSGFEPHPNCFMLNRNFGTIRPLTESEKEMIVESSNPLVTGQLWDKLHGVLKYYQAMYGSQ